MQRAVHVATAPYVMLALSSQSGAHVGYQRSLTEACHTVAKPVLNKAPTHSYMCNAASLHISRRAGQKQCTRCCARNAGAGKHTWNVQHSCNVVQQVEMWHIFLDGICARVNGRSVCCVQLVNHEAAAMLR